MIGFQVNVLQIIVVANLYTFYKQKETRFPASPHISQINQLYYLIVRSVESFLEFKLFKNTATVTIVTIAPAA